ncbi:MAG: hypothetical protein ACI935_002816 [Moritella dasanensis]|jgi:hypothetical protein
MVILLVSINDGLFTLPRRGFVQQENKLEQVTVGYVLLRYTILANHYVACYSGDRIIRVNFVQIF